MGVPIRLTLKKESNIVREIKSRSNMHWELGNEWKCRTGGCELDSRGSGKSLVIGSCEHDNKPSDCKNGEEFLDQLYDYKLLKKKSTSS
jgi:hypothetical protein